MQSTVIDLMRLGPLPSSHNPDVNKLEQFQTLLENIKVPISDDDVRGLVTLFGPDDCYGLAWTLLHTIETAENWPILDAITLADNEWIQLLKQRAGI